MRRSTSDIDEAVEALNRAGILHKGCKNFLLQRELADQFKLVSRRFGNAGSRDAKSITRRNIDVAERGAGINQVPGGKGYSRRS